MTLTHLAKRCVELNHITVFLSNIGKVERPSHCHHTAIMIPLTCAHTHSRVNQHRHCQGIHQALKEQYAYSLLGLYPH